LGLGSGELVNDMKNSQLLIVLAALILVSIPFNAVAQPGYYQFNYNNYPASVYSQNYGQYWGSCYYYMGQYTAFLWYPQYYYYFSGGHAYGPYGYGYH
jgi:hypothetical protein